MMREHDARVDRTMDISQRNEEDWAHSRADSLNLGRALRKYRKEVLKDTAPNVAMKLGIPWGTYARAERNECDYRRYIGMFKTLGFPTELWKNADFETHSIKLQNSLTHSLATNRNLLDEGRVALRGIHNIIDEIDRRELNGNH